MMLTEEEAKTKWWCPFARTVDKYPDGFTAPRNRVAIFENAQSDVATVGASRLVGVQCIGSACMAWREGIFNHQRNLAPEDRSPNVGYCGLAGRPE